MVTVLALDQGTTNSKALLVDSAGAVLGSGATRVTIDTPQPGWAEQSPAELWDATLAAIARAATATPAAITVSNQRETVVAWHRGTGEPLGPALGWQDTRTAAWCARPEVQRHSALVTERTGLHIDAMFSAPKFKVLLDQLPAGTPLTDVCLGTVESWLIWNLTGGQVHAAEAGNAGRTLLLNIDTLAWDDELLALFDIPRQCLGEVAASDADYGTTRGVPGLPDGIPIAAVMADSHSALYGHGCRTPGSGKATYGTGTSVMTPVAQRADADSPVGTTLAWVMGETATYAREGNIVYSGATLEWTRATLGLPDVAALVALAATVPDAGGAVLVPAFAGLGAPYWDRTAQATITGLSATTTPAHLARAAIDAVASQVCDIVDVVDSGPSRLERLRVDGGGSASALLVQTQADLLGRPVDVADSPDLSALGVGMLGVAKITGGTAQAAGTSASYLPSIDPDLRAKRRSRWHEAVSATQVAPRQPPT